MKCDKKGNAGNTAKFPFLRAFKIAVVKGKAYFAVAALCILWGTSYLFIRYGIDAFPPFQFAGMRQTLAGVLLLGFVFLLQRQKFPGWVYFRKQAVSGIMMIGLGNGLLTWGVQYVPIGTAALLGSTTPIIVVLFNWIMGTSERVNLSVIAGVILGFLGPLLIFSDHLDDFLNFNYALGIGLILFGSTTWAIASIWSKDYNIRYNTIMNAGFQMLSGGTAMLITSFILEKPTFANATWLSVGGLLYLAIVCSAIAFSLYFYALKHLPVTVVSLYNYVNPLVAIILGWLFLSETLSWNTGLAFVVTVAGIYLVNTGFRKAAATTDFPVEN